MDDSPNAVVPVPPATMDILHDEVSLMEELLTLRQENEKQMKNSKNSALKRNK